MPTADSSENPHPVSSDVKDWKDVPLQDIVNPIDREASTEEKVRQLEALTEANEPKIQEFIDQIDSQFGTKSKTSRKDAKKIAEKAKRPAILKNKPWHDVEHIRDSFRFKTVLNDISVLPEIAKRLKTRGFQIVKIDLAKVLRPDVWGWRIVVFDLKMPNGQLVEYYLPVNELEEAKNAGNHELFEAWRDEDSKTMTAGQSAKYVAALDESVEKYDAAWTAYLSRTKQTTNHVQEVLEETERVLKQ